MRVVRRAYYALVTYIDRKVGELLASLDENGFADNTIVIFNSDHGDMLCERGMVQKRTFYEWSARVPMIIKFPGGWQAGTVRSEPVNLIDLAPTFWDIAGIPEDERLPVDGRSLIGLLDGSDTDDWVTFSENPSDGMVEAPCFMIRWQHYKYVYIHGHAGQLFDLNADPGEWDNLIGDPAYADLEAELKSRLFKRFDPDETERAMMESYRRRVLIDRAMKANKTHWDVEPRFDPTLNNVDQYLK